MILPLFAHCSHRFPRFIPMLWIRAHGFASHPRRRLHYSASFRTKIEHENREHENTAALLGEVVITHASCRGSTCDLLLLLRLANRQLIVARDNVDELSRLRCGLQARCHGDSLPQSCGADPPVELGLPQISRSCVSPSGITPSEGFPRNQA